MLERDSSRTEQPFNGESMVSNDITLVKGKSRLDVRKCYFSQNTVNELNKLSADCVHSSSTLFVK